MKYIIVILLSFFNLENTNGQDKGAITSIDAKPKAGVPVIYYYHPPKHLLVPDKIHASIVYGIKDRNYFVTIPISKKHGVFKFSYRAPDSVQALIISINDPAGQIIDNNNEWCFVIYLRNQKGNIPSSAYLKVADLLSYYVPFALKINWAKAEQQEIKLFDKAYKLSPNLKNQSLYTYYLYLLYQENKNSVKPRLLIYAKKMASSLKDEDKWVNALYIYRILEMKKEYETVEKKATDTYPNGKVAQSKFIETFKNQTKYTEQSILDSMKEYATRFKDTSEQMRYTFYNTMISLLIEQKEWNKLTEYEQLIGYNQNVAHLYDAVAWNLCNTQPDKIDSNLLIAKMLSRKSLLFTKYKINKLGPDQNDGHLQKAYNNYTETYALILYKLGEYDSAFYFQNAIYKKNKQLSQETLERYAIYAEKTQGERFTYQFIVEQLMKGTNSSALVKQLKDIGMKLGLSDSIYNIARDKSIKLSAEIMSQKIREKFGSLQAKNFVLRNLANEPISLSSFKGKVIILDFLATWCGPCRASFPGIQNIMASYKSDTNVVFLFIDAFEHEGIKEVKKKVEIFIQENKYSFQILLDESDKVASDYEVERIPAKFIIDRRGNIVFMGETSNLEIEIENAKQ